MGKSIGLIIWAYSDCRSLMGIFREIRKQLDSPVVIVINESNKVVGLRQKTGFSHEEFNDVAVVCIENDFDRGIAVLDEYKGFNHLFTVYQKEPLFRKLISIAHSRHERVGIISEAPCIMSRGLGGVIKRNLYLPHLVPYIVRNVVHCSDFIINLSGDSTKELQMIGWAPDKIIPFGYFPPPLIGSCCKKRKNGESFHILVSGIMSWHRAPDVAIKALGMLKAWGLTYSATFTQNGPLLGTLRTFAKRYDLPIRFSGLLPMAELVSAYENCSLYLATGRSEPWGMRLNDALQCGAPLAVSRGMGGVQMVDRYGCGFSFNVDDYVDLANKLARVIRDTQLYNDLSEKAYAAAQQISPSVKVVELISAVNSRFPGWFPIRKI